MEIKQGDKVRVSEKTPIEYNPHGEYAPLCVINSVVRCVVNDYAMCEPIWDDGAIQTPFLIPCKYLVKVDAEAKEAKFKVGDKVKALFTDPIAGSVYCVGTIIGHDASDGTYHVQGKGGLMSWFGADGLEPYAEPTEQTEAEKTNHTISIPVEVDLTDSYWDAYAADLAKEIVLKTVNSASDRRPSAIAEYATDIAKAVVEGLKRK